MKLLKFLNSDAPKTLVDAKLTHGRLSFPSGKRSHGIGGEAKAWTLQTAPSSMQGGYWLLDDQDQPICVVTDILVAVSEKATGDGASVVATPRGITDGDIDGLDFRSKMGRQMEREHATYGSTYKMASNSTRLMMNAEEVTVKRQEKLKRDRETLAEAVENGESSALEPKRKPSSSNSGKRARR